MLKPELSVRRKRTVVDVKLPSWITENSLRNKVLYLFLPLIIAAVLIVGGMSYGIEVHQIKKNALILTKNTVNQTEALLNDRFSSVFQQLVAIYESSAVQGILLYGDAGDPTAKSNDIISIGNQFTNVFLSNLSMVDSFYFSTKSGTEVKLFENDVPMSTGINIDEWLEKYQGSDTGFYWLNSHTDTAFVTQGNRQVISIFANSGRPDSTSGAVLLMNLQSSYFSDILKNVKVSTNGYILLISRDGVMNTVRSKANNLTADTIGQLRDNMGRAGSMYVRSVGGKKMLVVYQSLKINNWVIAAVIPQGDLLSGAYQFLVFLAVIMILVILVSSYVAIRFSRTLTNSIEYLSRQVKEFDAGNLDVRFDVKDTNEIGVLANGLSCLTITVSNLVEEVKREQERKAKVELLALQSQIKPHFLYNTLGSIKHLIDMGKNTMASQMCGALSKFYMIGISKGKELIPVRQEIDHVRNYLLIQKMRYGEEFNYDIQISDEILDAYILKLTIQPIVENAIYHGIKNKPGSGIITLSGRKENRDILFEILDDGAGMSEEKLENLKKSIRLSGIEENPVTFGLRNVNQRIILHYGEPYGLQIESVEGVYTRVVIRIPFDFGQSL